MGAWKSVDMESCFPNSCSIFTRRRAANKEWPPKSKKLSVTLMASTPRSSIQIAANLDSPAFRGQTKSCRDRALSGAGKARRSTLPFEVNGKAWRNTKCDGTKYSGSFA